MTEHLQQYRDEITAAYLADELGLIQSFSDYIQPDSEELAAVTAESVRLIKKIRANPDFNKGLDAFMAEYSLDSIEGIRLMTLAEALARIPDQDTKEALIRSKLSGADWSRHVGKSVSPFVNSSTRALLFTSSVLESEEIPFLSDVIRRVGEPAIRMVIELGMGIFSDHFVLGETLEEAKKKITKEAKQYRHSFDMLGEAALTQRDADRFFASYKDAIEFAAEFRDSAVSIKLSALHPRYDATQQDRVHSELYPALNELIRLAKDKGVQITIDAEEMDRLDLSLSLFERLITQGAGRGFDQLGLAVHAYSKRSMAVLKYLNRLAESCGQRICVRLVKGAYWDTEVKHTQVLGLDDYPVFTLKPHTDIAFLACAKYLIANDHNLYPQFATHNVHTVANLLHWTENTDTTFEFQRLHGMGTVLYDCLMEEHPNVDCCIYAPIGQQRELLPYLIRRLLENSANSSFVNQLASNTDAEELSRHPINVARSETHTIVKPPHLYFPVRDNSRGLNLRFSEHRDELLDQIASFHGQTWTATPAQPTNQQPQDITAPMGDIPVGTVTFADADTVTASIEAAKSAAAGWQNTEDSRRIEIINRLANLLEAHRGELIALMALEGGKTLDDGIAEVREAVDFCRYYANQMKQFGERHNLPGPNGEVNELYYAPRGVFACISPWNFPVAIFTGQVAAALVSGNTVVAKPAEQTCLVAARVCELIHKAGVPKDVLQFLPGDGENAGAPLVKHTDINGVVFTGSVATGHAINRTLAAKDGPMVPLIAETGGQNTMIVDSSALPEQVVQDVIASAFKSAGQRCSALRVLYLQESCADTVLEMLAGAMQELVINDPRQIETDIGPVIDAGARRALEAHIADLEQNAKLVARTPLSHTNHENGHWVAPCCYEIDSIEELEDEHFGPVLHVIRFTTDELSTIFEEIAGTGYGLTLGIHSRNEQMVEYISNNIPAGNIYVNRNMVGAIVGSQPFGGLGLSGTGPKAGGPNYLARFMVEKSRSNNTAAVGGAIDLINQPT